MTLDKALPIANSIVELLAPECTIINVAGSCRRMKPDVGDIEIVALPKSEPVFDLFDEHIGWKRSGGFIRKVRGLGDLYEGSPIDGRSLKINLPEGVKLDLFLPRDYDYWRIFAIRTGSQKYSANVLAAGWKKLGWCGTKDGLRKISDCEAPKTNESKPIYKCTNPNPELPPIWESEEHFFEWLNVPFISPTERNL